MKANGYSHMGVVSCNSDVIDQVGYIGERYDRPAKLEITFCTKKKYFIEGSAASDIWAEFNLAVSNNESIGQWFNRKVRNQFDLVSA
jgi:hypothetical protein